MKTEKQWYYFGCGDDVGHYLFDKNKNKVHVPELEKFDGELCPPTIVPGEPRQLYRAALFRHSNIGYSSLGWWDNSVDKRSGSNSIIFAPGSNCSEESILEGMRLWFPWVEERLPEPLSVIPLIVFGSIPLTSDTSRIIS